MLCLSGDYWALRLMTDDDVFDSEEEGLNEASATGDLPSGAGVTCLSCGASTIGVYCVACGQKNDDLRRSIFLLARDFVEDTFSFDSRMWRTLGSLAISPGLVPKAFSHGKRSRYTPPVRLFLVVSFLFFLLLGLTNTYFVAVKVAPLDEAGASITFLQNKDKDPKETGEQDCSMNASLTFFVRASELNRSKDDWSECVAELQAKLDASVEEGGDEVTEDDRRALALIKKMAEGVRRAVEKPDAFNAAFDDWLPRVLLFMTPVSALILTIFLRGREALFFDHLVLAFYTHAFGFAVVSAAILLTQTGLPYAGFPAALLLGVYFVRSLKRAYGRGWVKTIWTAFAGGGLYLLILFLAVLAIVFQILRSA